MYEIETLLDQVSSVCGLSNELDEIDAKPTLNHWINRKTVPCFVSVHPGLFSTKISQGQALANFLADHPSLEIQPKKDVKLGIYEVKKRPWILKFDGSRMGRGSILEESRAKRCDLIYQGTDHS